MTANYQRLGLVGAVTSVALIITSACSGTSGGGGASSANEVVIGVTLPLTGALAQEGQNSRDGLLLAQTIINGEYPKLGIEMAAKAGLPNLGGKKIKLIFSDNQGDPGNSRADVQRFISRDHATALMGAYSSALTQTASQAAEQARVPFVAGTASSLTLTKRGYK